MHILNADVGDPMLLDSRVGLRALYDQFAQFLESGVSVHAFQAKTNGSPHPYDEFIKGLRVKKSDSESSLCLAADGWLVLSGNDAELMAFSNELLIQEDGDHHHWYSKPISLIIEADDDWLQEKT